MAEYTNLVGGYAPSDLSDEAAAEHVKQGICSTFVKPEEQAWFDFDNAVVSEHKPGLKIVAIPACAEAMHPWQAANGLMLGEIVPKSPKRAK